VLCALLQHAAGDGEQQAKTRAQHPAQTACFSPFLPSPSPSPALALTNPYPTPNQIVAEYAASAAQLSEDAAVLPTPQMPWQRRGRSEPQERAADGPVDWSALRGSPAKAMQDTLAWVRQEYGAVDAFLEGAGADEAWRRTLLSRNSR